MSSSTRVAKCSSVAVAPNRLCATVRNGRPSVSSHDPASACPRATAVLSAASCSAGPEPAVDAPLVPGRPGSRARRDSAGRKPPTSGSARGSSRTVSLTSQLSWRQASKTTFSQVWFGCSGGDHPPDRVVEQHRADADRDVELEAVGAVKNGSYWRTGLPLLLKIVQPLPTQRGVATVRRPPSVASGPGLGLHLLLDLAPEAVGVGEAVLDLASPPSAQVARVGLAGQRRRPTAGCGRGSPRCGCRRTGRRRAGWSRPAAARAGRRAGPRGTRRSSPRSRSGSKPGQRVARAASSGLAHHRGADDQAQRVEGDRGPVAVGVGHQPRLQHAVVAADGASTPVAARGVAVRLRRRAGRSRRSATLVLAAERVAEAARQEEVLVARAPAPAPARRRRRRVEDLPDGTHQLVVALGARSRPRPSIGVGRPGRRTPSATRLGREREPVGLERQSARLERAERQRPGQVVAAVERADVLDQPLARRAVAAVGVRARTAISVAAESSPRQLVEPNGRDALAASAVPGRSARRCASRAGSGVR